MPSTNDSPPCLPASAEPNSRFTLFAWVSLSLLGVFALLANAPAPRRIFSVVVLLSCIAEGFNRDSLIRRYWAAFLPWVAVVLASALWSPFPSVTLGDALWEIISPIAAGLLAMSVAARIGQRHFWLPFALIGIFVVPCLLGALHVHAGFWPELPQLVVGAYAGRGVASTMGIFLTLIGIAVIGINWRVAGGRKYRLIFLGGWLLIAGVLLGVLGHNRMYWFALPIGLLPWLVRIGNLPKRMRFGLIGSLLMVVAMGILYSNYLAKLPAVGDAAPSENLSSYVKDPRWVIWHDWLAVAAERPLLGIGYGSRIMSRVGEQKIAVTVDYNVQQHAHNLLLNIIVQTGLVGLLCFLFALRGVWRLLFDARGAVAEVPGTWQLAALSLVLAALAKSMTDDFFWGPAGVVMWMFVGVFAARRR